MKLQANVLINEKDKYMYLYISSCVENKDWCLDNNNRAYKYLDSRCNFDPTLNKIIATNNIHLNTSQENILDISKEDEALILKALAKGKKIYVNVNLFMHNHGGYFHNILGSGEHNEKLSKIKIHDSLQPNYSAVAVSNTNYAIISIS